MSDDEDTIRAAALLWLRDVTADGRDPISRYQLANEFRIDGSRFPLLDRVRGIRKPVGWRSALSITTTFSAPGKDRPYEDAEGPDGLHRYKLRRDERGSAENAALRVAMREQIPLVWFVGVAPGVFNAIFPVWILGEEPEEDQFVLALSPVQRQVQPGSVIEPIFRRYLLTETTTRLHQAVFSSQVMLAYETKCAVCALGHRELLDAAHIVPDSAPNGDPVVTNGLSLCKIHHAAYDRDILGIRPDLVVEIRHDLLAELDGPMLRHGLQEHHGKRLLQVPRRRSQRPDRERLSERYDQFRAA